MNIRALATLGPSLNKADFVAADNVVLETFVRHSAVLPHAAALVSQCGLGTLSKALRQGVPLLCMPLIADQPNNAARIVVRGAGLLLRPDASSDAIRAALERLISEPSFRDAARRLGHPMVGNKAEARAADELEAIVPTPRHTTANVGRS
jgi:UDP:flavonoid glycosyltransferase YjiC (YdhE family)